MNKTKRCSACHVVKPVEQFWKRSAAKGTYEAKCIDCERISRGHAAPRLKPVPAPEGMRICVDPLCTQPRVPRPIADFVYSRSRSASTVRCRQCQNRSDNKSKRKHAEQIYIKPDGDNDFRMYFPSELEWQAAMQRAKWLEQRKCPIRAHRVRLNVEGAGMRL